MVVGCLRQPRWRRQGTPRWRSFPRSPASRDRKELVGNYRNGGCDFRLKDDPYRVNVSDFEDKKLGMVVPWRAYQADLDRNLTDLHDRVHRGPSRRTYIPKADGRQRPLATT